MRRSAAASLKLICRWMELQLGRVDKPEVVQQLRSMFQEVLVDGGHSNRMPDLHGEEGQSNPQGDTTLSLTPKRNPVPLGTRVKIL
jgi:hypothetical protein